jgi:beta-N-acetylhexosaminidase
MRRHLIVALITAILAAIGVRSAPPSPHQAHVTAASPQSIAAAAYARMTRAERIGELFMTGVPATGSSSAGLASLRKERIGNVILVGDNGGGVASAKRVTDGIASKLRFAGVGAFISTDQEGGEVQRLTGTGFATMPSALQQGKLTASRLKTDSTRWGRQLAAAGINLDLAPVADTVPAKHASDNAPIGRFDREFGHTPTVVAQHVVPFVEGMNAGGVDTTVKHFPGLGRATGNTDTMAGVTDPTTRHGSYIAPYRAGVMAGTQFVMVSSARYPAIDPHHIAAFSTTIIGSMLRGDLAFKGVVISDDLGTSALHRFSDGRRATNFFGAGGTMLLATTASLMPAMIAAVTAKAASSPAFAAQLKTDEMTVLLAKARAGLIRS